MKASETKTRPTDWKKLTLESSGYTGQSFNCTIATMFEAEI
ncbi:hypothetical protein Hanom_Chr11g01034561 [Helianthus anomalus]